MSKTLVIFSGGMDSTLILNTAVNAGHSVIAVYFKAKDVETYCVKQQIEYYRQRGHEVELIEVEIPIFRDEDAKPNRRTGYVDSKPYRNLIFLSYAVSLAQIHKCSNVLIGCNQGDGAVAWDCTKVFIDRFNDMINGNGFKVTAPLIDLTFDEYINISRQCPKELLNLTWSCYNPTETEEGWEKCGKCFHCEEKRKIFELLNIPKVLKKGGEK